MWEGVRYGLMIRLRLVTCEKKMSSDGRMDVCRLCELAKVERGERELTRVDEEEEQDIGLVWEKDERLAEALGRLQTFWPKSSRVPPI